MKTGRIRMKIRLIKVKAHLLTLYKIQNNNQMLPSNQVVQNQKVNKDPVNRFKVAVLQVHHQRIVLMKKVKKRKKARMSLVK